jgi:hypothetical protein
MADQGTSSWTDERYPSRKTVNDFHHSSDLDLSTTAQHHTIGLGRNQSAGGNHNHRDGNGQPLLDDVTFTGSKTTNTATVLGQVISALVLLGATDATT